MRHAFTPPGAAPRALVNILARNVAGLPRHLADNAACRFDPELHTGPDAFTAESDQDRAARVQVAREVCAECPVWASCLFHALAVRPGAGVWAGLTADEIAALPGPADAAACAPREVA
ncbi:WhiB family transcriptional regulator [Spongiactinospora sp. TRM90649]|uniref:WhiB family transcriptional regulator n=1 Tax=Spongiactinospora sp. TRM90649 TaxID=3031114 RepID=UPI0023FA2E07|nr:WhiB family transcriptional regulator [Spongiactinospora sp. TRM90649]MDF5758644.1 WhiB family transcriptional regulator [Spongiactinospora sp. TRM90649]